MAWKTTSALLEDHGASPADLLVRHQGSDRGEDSPADWPIGWDTNEDQYRTNGGPIAQWSRLEAGRSDDLGTSFR